MSWVSVGVTGVSLIAGGIQAGTASEKAKRAQRQLENMNPPPYKENQSISDFYREALRKYNLNPTDTREYKATAQGIKQGTVQGLNYLQDRRSGLAGVPNLIANQNKGLLDTAINQERRKDIDLSVLGDATSLKSREGDKEFQFNKIAPFEKNYNLLALKGGAYNEIANAGLQNIFNGLSSASQMYMVNKMYGSGQQPNSNGGNWYNSYLNNIGKYGRTDPRLGG